MSTTLQQTIAESADKYHRQAARGVSHLNLEEAACRFEDLELFFSVGEGREDEAKAVCRRCAVRWECLTYAIETRQRHGVWGGLNPDERGLLLRKLRSEAAH